MNDYEDLFEQAQAELQTKTEAHAASWGLGKDTDWGLEQDEGELILIFDNGVEVRAPAQIIGSYNSNDGSWMWSWANSSILQSLTEDARRVRAYGEEHKIGRLITPKWTGEESEGWAMTALAVKLCDAQCAYRGPVGDSGSYIFMTFGEVKLSKANG